ncbi:AraC family transcriptional regulator [Chitinophaga niabensis]|uniref:AraC family transcriptional regulator n=1 Tax=Chitinophaga niabensis TaxID=536979 RepID=UPI0031BB654D
MKQIPIRHIKAAGSTESFSIREIGDMVQELHRHDFFYLLVLKKGKGTHAIDFIPYEVSDNTVFFMRPGQVHELTLKAGSKGYLMAFKAGFHTTKSTTNYYQPNSESFYKLLSVLKDIFREYTDQQEGYQKVIKANLEILFIILLRLHGKSNAATYEQERLEEFLSLLETHIAGHKQASQYAAMLHLSPYQLNAITKATLGKTCSELINEHIILESKRCLLATTEQVNQIAWHLGYEDVSYFIRFFKKHTGYSPEAFRQKCR